MYIQSGFIRLVYHANEFDCYAVVSEKFLMDLNQINDKIGCVLQIIFTTVHRAD